MCGIYVLIFHSSAFLKGNIHLFSSFISLGSYNFYFFQLYIYFFHPACLYAINLNPYRLPSIADSESEESDESGSESDSGSKESGSDTNAKGTDKIEVCYGPIN